MLNTLLKKLMIGAGLAAIVATSAMAQSYQPEVGSGNITPKPEYSNTVRSGNNAFAFERTAPHHHTMHHHNQNLDRD